MFEKYKIKNKEEFKRLVEEFPMFFKYWPPIEQKYEMIFSDSDFFKIFSLEPMINGHHPVMCHGYYEATISCFGKFRKHLRTVQENHLKKT